MPESFSAVQLLRHLGRNWAVFASAVAAAAVLAFVGSILTPNRYRAETRLLIEAPTGSDPRSALVISPVYIDSLKSYALMASSDELFEQAVGELGLRDAVNPEPLSTLKASILEVEVLGNTKILSIRATLRDAQKAQALALYLAEATIERNQELQAAGGRLRAGAANEARDAAVSGVSEIEAELLAASRQRPVAGLEVEVEMLTAERESLREELRLVQRGSTALIPGETPAASVEPLEARVARLRSEIKRLDAELREKTIRLSSAIALHDAIEDRLTAAREILSEANARLADESAAQPTRGERLQILDRGVVPDRPSSPQVGVNVIVASALALVLSLLFVTLRFSLSLAGPESD